MQIHRVLSTLLDLSLYITKGCSLKKHMSEAKRGLTMLGNSELSIPTSPDEAKLEKFENIRPGRKYVIHLNCPEFSSLCPVTGQPDSAFLSIRYIPGKYCVETKSLKYYMASYRNTKAFNEEVVNRVLDDLVSLLDPQEIEVIGEFGSRGGIQLTCEASYPEKESL